MNAQEFNAIFNNKIPPTRKKCLLLYLASDGESNDEIMEKLDVKHRTTIINNLKNVCNDFGIKPEAITDYLYELVELIWKYKPEIINPELLKKLGFIVEKPSYPDSLDYLKSPFYIERKSQEEECYQLIIQSVSLIHLKAPRKMGKTSLIKRVIAQAKRQKYQTIYLNLSLIDNEQFQNMESFCLSFYQAIIYQLPEIPPLTEWNKNVPSNINCTRHLEELLKQAKSPLLLVLDEVDKLFTYPKIYLNFFPMLRVWYEQGKESETWEKLRLIVSHSTDDYGRLDIHQSPFNVGYPITLKEFNQEEVRMLTSRHGLPQDTGIALMEMVGGHPYLLRLALYELYYERTSLKELLGNAPTDSGIYRNHLLPYLEIFQQNQELKAVFQQIIASSNPIKLREKTTQIYQLEGMGLIKLVGDFIHVSCELYRRYFYKRLN